MPRGYRDEDNEQDEDTHDAGRCRAIRGTAKALLIKFPDGDERWVPRSVIHDDSEVYDDDENREGRLVLKLWWAQENELAE